MMLEQAVSADTVRDENVDKHRLSLEVFGALINLSGRGDKDCQEVARLINM